MLAVQRSLSHGDEDVLAPQGGSRREIVEWFVQWRSPVPIIEVKNTRNQLLHAPKTILAGIDDHLNLLDRKEPLTSIRLRYSLSVSTLRWCCVWASFE